MKKDLKIRSYLRLEDGYKMWTYEGKEVNSHDDLDPLCTNFVYVIHYTNGQAYIGKRTVRSMSILPVLKTKVRDEGNLITRHILRGDDGKIITSKAAKKAARLAGVKAKAELFEEVFTDKPFIKYEGSSEETKGLVIAAKEIIYQCSTKQTSSYLEEMLLFEESAVVSPDYINANVGGRYFDSCLDGLIETEEK